MSVNVSSGVAFNELNNPLRVTYILLTIISCEILFPFCYNISNWLFPWNIDRAASNLPLLLIYYSIIW